MADTYLVAGGVLSMTAQAASRLLEAGNGDAALTYLWLLRAGGVFDQAALCRALKWDPARADAAFSALAQMGLADRGKTAPPAPDPTDALPDYSSADITAELSDPTSRFADLTDEVQRRLGKLLSTAEMKSLLTLYDHLALPAEVILLLVNWCIEEMERKYGPGRKPRMSQISREGFAWHRLGIDTAESADAHLKKLSSRREDETRILALVGVTGRAAVESERRYVDAWSGWRMSDELIRLAYERTVMKKQSMNWAYMNSILRAWHEKGFTTEEQVLAGDSTLRTGKPQQGQTPNTGGARQKDSVAWMKKYLAEQEGGDGHGV